MGVFTALNTTLDIIEKAAKVVEKSPTAAKVFHAVDVADRANRAGGAITQFSGQTTILSRAFMDERVVDEPVLPGLMRATHSWYTAQVISALHLSQMVDGVRTVQDVMSVVQTGQNARQTGVITHTKNNIWSAVRDRRVAQESFLTQYSGVDMSTDGIGLEDLHGPMTREQSDRYASNQETVAKQHMEDRINQGVKGDTTHHDNTVSVKSVETDHRMGPMGELYEVKLTNPNGNGQSTTVPIFIQMQPSVVPASVAPRFIDMNVTPSLWQRWTQMRAGELTFWRDFLLNRDLIKRQKSILKDKKLALAFQDFLRTVAKKDKYAIDDATDHLGARQSSNLANSVMVFSEETLAEAKAETGIDLHNETDRVRYFRDTYTMIIMVIDPMHQRVTIYFNGLEGELNASYNDFRSKDGKVDPKDFMAAIQAFSTNNISRMR